MRYVKQKFRENIPCRSDSPFLDIVAIDHLPSLLPRESSEKYASKLAPYLSLLPKVGLCSMTLKS